MAKPGREGYAFTRVYRAVSEAEYRSILALHCFSRGLNSLEGKWFADSLEGALKHGEALHGSGNFRIVEADVPAAAPSLFCLNDIDGRGPARYLHLDDLHGVRPREVTRS